MGIDAAINFELKVQTIFEPEFESISISETTNRYSDFWFNWAFA